ncbi:hypothetical protein RERY_66420 [Rhodococcus erythropolis]|nr:hypothetical protein RERY_66420 [Rhodococcus erythropolis]OQM80785.1 hypothetical protein B0E55_02923 [Rhodococcus sp. 66b]
MRCCASDNGISAGRTCATSAFCPPLPTCDSMCAASASTVETSNSVRTGTVVSSARPNREVT